MMRLTEKWELLIVFGWPTFEGSVQVRLNILNLRHVTSVQLFLFSFLQCR